MDFLMDFPMQKDLMMEILKLMLTEIPMQTAINYWIHWVIGIKTRLGIQTVTQMVIPKHLAIKMGFHLDSPMLKVIAMVILMVILKLHRLRV
jgi:hypothetical protein